MTQSNMRPAPISIRKVRRDERDWLYIYLSSNVAETVQTDMDGEEHTMFEYTSNQVRLPLPDVAVTIPAGHAENQDALKAQLKQLFADNATLRTALSTALAEAELVDWQDKVVEWTEIPAINVATEKNWKYWVPAELVKIGDQRYYGDVLYEVVQGHKTQSDWTPELTTPTLWIVIPQSSEWVSGAKYAVDDVVTYDGVEYKCLQGHVSQSDWTPPAVPTLWTLVTPPAAEWAYPVAYTIGDIVTFSGNLYECRQSHISNISWTPAAVLALWLPI